MENKNKPANVRGGEEVGKDVVGWGELKW